jgi:hypothetical protein
MLKPGTDAVADLSPHDDESSHNQGGTNTNCGDGGCGLSRIAGAGSRSALTACSASRLGPGAAA